MAIIVPFITLLGIFITACIAFLTWSRGLKYQILKDERDRLEKKGELVLELYLNALMNNSINAKLAAIVTIEFPENVSQEFEKSVSERIMSSQNEDDKKTAYFRMAFEISKSIKELDKKIIANSQVVDMPFAKDQFLAVMKTTSQFVKFF